MTRLKVTSFSGIHPCIKMNSCGSSVYELNAYLGQMFHTQWMSHCHIHNISTFICDSSEACPLNDSDNQHNDNPSRQTVISTEKQTIKSTNYRERVILKCGRESRHPFPEQNPFLPYRLMGSCGSMELGWPHPNGKWDVFLKALCVCVCM